MILADKIINERKKNGWSQEELAERINVSRQSVSRWEGAQSIPDLQKIIQLAELFGVSTDYLLKDELESDDRPAEMLPSPESGEPVIRVSMETACAFLEDEARRAPAVAWGVVLCILSPVVLILLEGFAETGLIGLSEDGGAAIGVAVLLLMVACAVFLFFTSGKRREELEFLEEEDFETEYGVSGMVRERRDMHRERRNLFVTLGVVLCILCSLPLILCSALNAPEAIIILMVDVLLIFVAAAVYLFIRSGIVEDSFNILLQEKDFTKKEKEKNRRLGPVGGIYWCLVTAIYLAISFLTEAWDRSWIVWPVAGVLFAAVMGIAGAILGKKK